MFFITCIFKLCSCNIDSLPCSHIMQGSASHSTQVASTHSGLDRRHFLVSGLVSSAMIYSYRTSEFYALCFHGHILGRSLMNSLFIKSKEFTWDFGLVLGESLGKSLFIQGQGIHQGLSQCRPAECIRIAYRPLKGYIEYRPYAYDVNCHKSTVIYV